MFLREPERIFSQPLRLFPGCAILYDEVRSTIMKWDGIPIGNTVGVYWLFSHKYVQIRGFTFEKEEST